MYLYFYPKSASNLRYPEADGYKDASRPTGKTARKKKPAQSPPIFTIRGRLDLIITARVFFILNRRLFSRFLPLEDNYQFSALR